LDNGVDLAITTDHRQVLSEIIASRQNKPKIQTIFPGFQMGSALNFIA
jgi:hypothetical protein